MTRGGVSFTSSCWGGLPPLLEWSRGVTECWNSVQIQQGISVLIAQPCFRGIREASRGQGLLSKCDLVNINLHFSSGSVG